MAELLTATFGNKQTPEQTLIDALPQVKNAQVVVIVFLDKDEYIYSCWSDGSMLQRLGMLDVAKSRMLAQTEEEEE